jgi:CRP-like cAMP-binding protein
MNLNIKNFFQKQGKEIRLQPKEYLFRENSKADHIYCVNSGILAILKEDHKKANFLVNFADPGQLIGLCAFKNPIYAHSVEAITEAQVLVLSAEQVKNVMQDDFSLRLEVVQEMCKEVSLAESKLVNAPQKTIKQRIGMLILELQKAYKKAIDETETLYLPYSLNDLAVLLGIPPKNATKTIAELHSEGLISKEGSFLKINNRQAIEEYALSSS